MYRRIAAHPSVRKLWAARLAERGVLSEAEAESVWKNGYERLVAIQEQVRQGGSTPPAADGHSTPADATGAPGQPATGVSAERLRELDRQLHAWPVEFHPVAKLARQLERRSHLLEKGGAIDWGHAEALALASLLSDGIPIRLTGQDAERGTFSHRHAVLRDAESGARHIPLAALEGLRVPFEIHNSPLSELAALGFEYGYSVVAPRALVLWEAQFGDFVNGAQVVIDQFLTAGRQKWNQLSRLVLLLPHGSEGQGPEHSSARLERFLQAAAEDNIRVVNCTTPAQYFHLLRRQALDPAQRPLIVMTPKSLLRHPRAVSTLEELQRSRFEPLLPLRAGSRTDRALFCSGKIAWELDAALDDNPDAAERITVVRIEQLYPFPATAIAAYLSTFAEPPELLWVQEEPRNMGAWPFVEPAFREQLGRSIAYVGRPERASPAEGQAADHESEQGRIVAEALTGALAGARSRR
jgi:2-oxoglutarate dehydrogenase E1 component